MTYRAVTQARELAEARLPDLDKVIGQVVRRRTWFTADHHFGHGRIVGYCDRPWWTTDLTKYTEHLRKVTRADELGIPHWPDVAAMEEALVAAWNARVAPGDRVFHLGDFAWWHLPVEEVRRIRARLNGEIILIRGNHDQDPKTKKLTAAVSEVFPNTRHARMLTLEGRRILMYHYGPHSWGQGERARKKHRTRVAIYHPAAWKPDLLLHGHSHCHGGLVVREWEGIPTVDVGVEGWGYAPVSLDEILERVEKER